MPGGSEDGGSREGGENRFVRGAAFVLLWSCTASSVALVVLFVWTAASRAAYPFDLEWMEGGMVDCVARLVAGKSLYAAPSVEFVPFIYNPLYYFLAVPATVLFGVGHFALRLVSIVATLVTLGIGSLIVWREVRSKVAACVAAGLYAGAYALSGGWFDLARVDATSLAFCMGAWYLARFASTAWGTAASAALLSCAFLSKQGAAALFPALFLSTALVHGLRRTRWLLPGVLALAAVMAVLEGTSRGWYSFYTLSVPSGFGYIPAMALGLWKKEIFSVFPVPIVFGSYLAVSGGGGDSVRAARRVHVPFVVSMIGMSLAVRMHSGSGPNENMPAYAGLSVVAGIGFGRLLDTESSVARLRRSIFGATLVLLQFLFLAYSPAVWVPTASDLAEGNRFMASVASYAGDVLVTHHGAVTRRAGKASFAQGMAVIDVMRTSHDRRGARELLRKSFERAFARHRFSAVFTDDDAVMNELLERYYERRTPSFVQNENAFLPKCGAPFRPRLLYEPRPR